ncbi:MAG TPA: Fe-Mn family superoxide dismutase [Candidatus Baltobacteraceae bacterium]|nr:Fe-Mn family superoxide dismutase [Candidatus Baltobacteraceae bacterium]
MNLLTVAAYTPRKWHLSGLHGISDETLAVHFGLYEGYVKNTNLLNERIAESRRAGANHGDDPSYAELVRRLGWEFDGMRLHEYYFDNLTSQRVDLVAGPLWDVVTEQFGSVDAWKRDFAALGNMRGIGWVIAHHDRASDLIVNTWVGDHNLNNLAGCEPILVMDVWEHAFLLDYKPAKKGDYIEAFLSNVDWRVCEARLRG